MTHICTHCKITLPAEGTGFCWNCGFPLLENADAQPLCSRLLPAGADHSSVKTVCPIRLWINLDSKFLAGQEDILPCKIHNSSRDTFTRLTLTAHFWQQPTPPERQIMQILQPQDEITVGIPFGAERPGRLLLTRLSINLYAMDERMQSWQTRDEIVLPILSRDTQGPVVYQVHLQDYAQLFGHIEIGGDKMNWQSLELIQAQEIESTASVSSKLSPPAILAVKTITPEHERDYFLSPQETVYLGRSRKAEFQILVPGYAPQHPKNLQISGKHAQMYGGQQGWRLSDCDSHNGTYINGKKLESGAQKTVLDGDIVNLGLAVELLCKLYPLPGSAKSLPTLRLSYLHYPPADMYILARNEVLLGSSAYCALHFPQWSEEAGRIVCGQTYALQMFVAFSYNGHDMRPYQQVTLKGGDRIGIANVVLGIEIFTTQSQ